MRPALSSVVTGDFGPTVVSIISFISILEVELSTSDGTEVLVSVINLVVDTIESVVKVVMDWRVVTVVGGVSDFSVICVGVTSSGTPDTRVLLSNPSVEGSVTSAVSVVVSGPELGSSVILDIKMSNRGSVSNGSG